MLAHGTRSKTAGYGRATDLAHEPACSAAAAAGERDGGAARWTGRPPRSPSGAVAARRSPLLRPAAAAISCPALLSAPG
jgi:hypothetical protein